MESNFNLGSFKIVHEHLVNYLNKSLDNINEALHLITVEKKLPTNYEVIDLMAKSQKTLEMIGLHGLSQVLGSVQSAVTDVKSVKFDTKKSVEVMKISAEVLEQCSSYINRLLVSGKDNSTVLYPLFEKLSLSIGLTPSIKSIFFPKLEFSESVDSKIKNIFKSATVINDSVKTDLLNKLKLSHNIIQSKLINIFNGIDLYGEFSNEEEVVVFTNAVNDVSNAFENLQKVNINKNFYILFGLYKFYVNLLNPSVNKDFKEFIANYQHEIKVDLGQFERQVARLIQSISSIEIGDKTSSLKPDETSIKDFIFTICSSIGGNDSILSGDAFKTVNSIYPLSGYMTQLTSGSQKSIVFTNDEINAIKESFYDLRDNFNSFSILSPLSSEFISGLGKTTKITKKLSKLTANINPIAQIIDSIDSAFISIGNNKNIFTTELRSEVSSALVLIESGLNNYISNNLVDSISSNFIEQSNIMVQRISLALNGDLESLQILPLVRIDDFSQKVEEEKTISEIFKQVQTELLGIEDTLDYFLRNEGENLEEIKSVVQPLNKLKGVFSIVGDIELIDVVNKILTDWINVYETGSFDIQELQESISLISGVSLYVKALATGNTNEAEELKINLMKLFYKNNNDILNKAATIAPTILETEVVIDPTLDTDDFTLDIATTRVESDLKLDENIGFSNNQVVEDLSLELPSFLNKKESKPEEEVVIEVNIDSPGLDFNSEQLTEVEQDVILVDNEQVIAGGTHGKIFIESTNDPEIAEVFLEEANEVLTELKTSLPLLIRTKDLDSLKNVRRAFHTLKGSGRMVGLEYMGEAAWYVEQTLNKVINNEISLDNSVIDLCQTVVSRFSEWIEILKEGKVVEVDLSTLKSLALNVNPELTGHVEVEIESSSENIPTEEIEFVSEQSSFVELEPNTQLDQIETVDTVSEVLPLEIDVVEEFTVSPVLVEELPSDNNEKTLEFENHISDDLEVEVVDENIVDNVSEVFVDGVSVSANLYDIFNEESASHIEALKDFAHSNYESDIKVDYSTMRHAHTLASISASVNMMLVSELSGKLEDLFQYCLDNEVSLNQNQLSPIRHATDNLDLLKTTDSSSYISYCDGLIEALSDLQDKLEETQLAPKQSSSVDVDLIVSKLSQSFLSKIEDLSSNFDKTIERLVEENKSLNKTINDLNTKLASLDNYTKERDKDFADREKNLVKALELNKNDIRIMANIVKKKSDAREAELDTEVVGVQESELSAKLDELTGGLVLDDESVNSSLEGILDNVEEESSKGSNPFFLEYPLAMAIFEDKVSNVVDEIDQEIYELTILESEEMLENINKIIENTNSDGLPQEKLKELKRFMHTIKGSSRMAGANKVGMVMHRLESLIDFVETRSINIYKIVDLISEELSKITFLFKNQNKSLTVGQLNWLDSSVNGEILNNQDINVQNLNNLDISSKSNISQQFIRVPTSIVDSAITDAGEIRLTRTSLEEINNVNFRSIGDLKSSSSKLLKMLKEIEVQAESQIKARKELIDSESADFDPLEFDRFTRLQELTRFMNETVSDIHESVSSLEVNSKTQEATVSQQSIVSNSLLSELMKVRLVPFGSISDRFYKIARNTAKELDKKVLLEITGENTEIDKVILDKVISPIEHLLRNSIAHGIESSTARSVYNKSPIGNVQINISLDGNSTIISIKDDGAGINTDKIKEIALGKNLILPNVNYSEEDIINLIFQSGFSTAESVSQVAGRGVGMDVVKSEITALGGTIKVVTSQNKGSEFILSLPMSIATNQATLVSTLGKLIGIPAVLVEEIDSVKQPIITKAYKDKTYNFNGVDYPFYYLGHLLGIVDKSILPDFKTYNNIILVKYVDQSIVIHVDKVLTTTDVLIKSLGNQFSKIEGILGATVLGDGQQGIVVNPVQVLKYFEKVIINIETSSAKTTELKSKTNNKITVMVVDDSITVRRASSKVLERNNYNVILAKDGEDALEQLQISVPDIILSDIEMPRMDGFEFVKNIRNIEKYHNIPVIMITSRTADKHKSYAFELGANDFLGKPYKEEELIEKIQLQLENLKENINV